MTHAVPSLCDCARARPPQTAPLELHTDSSFLAEPFGHILFQRVRHECAAARTARGAEGGCGGETMLLDGLALSDALRAADPAAHARLASVAVPWVYRPSVA